MQIVRFVHRGSTLEGEVVDQQTVRTPNGSTVPVSRVELLTPCSPSKIVCVERNFDDPDDPEGAPLPGEPSLFLKPPSAAIAGGADIECPEYSNLLQFGGQVAVVISRRCRNVRAYDAADVILGYTAFNDVTARDTQREDDRWTRAKCFDTSAPLGPAIETSADLLDVPLRTYVNGDLRQESSTSDLVFRVPHLIAFISRVMTLERGDVVATGTPAGVGELRRGDTVEVRVGELAPLVNTVAVADTEQRIDPPPP